MIAILLGMAMAASPPIRDEERVLATMEEFLAALRSHDNAKMLALTLPDGGATAVGDGRVLRFSWADYVAKLPTNVTLDERLRDHLVRVDGEIAMLWAHYDVHVDGKLATCGMDHADMVRVNGQWRILNLTWTQRTEPCPRR